MWYKQAKPSTTVSKNSSENDQHRLFKFPTFFRSKGANLRWEEIQIQLDAI